MAMSASLRLNTSETKGDRQRVDSYWETIVKCTKGVEWLCDPMTQLLVIISVQQAPFQCKAPLGANKLQSGLSIV